jgi:hypothetical protein
VRTQVYRWLLQEFRPENQSTTDARNMVSTPRMVVRACSGTSFHLSSQVSKPDTLTFGGFSCLEHHELDRGTCRCATMLPTLHTNIRSVRYGLNCLYCSQQRQQQSSGSWVYACHSRHLFSLWERDCSAFSARRRYHSVSTVNIR